MSRPSDPDPVAARSAPMARFFAKVMRRQLRAQFRAVRIARPGLPKLPEDRPVMVVCNHPSWWDPAVMIGLHESLFAARTGFGPIEAKMLETYPFMRRIGLFGVEEGRRGAASFLRVAGALMERPDRVLWITAQGRFADPRERPLGLRPGAAHLMAWRRDIVALPMALEYPFWSEKRPEALIRFGAPVMARTGEGAEEIGARLEAALTQSCDALAELALAQRGVTVEVVVLDDGSSDGTDRIVAERAKADPRVRLLRGAVLPKGWIGKTHACWQLSRAARHPVLLFVDADVRLAPDAAARMTGEMARQGLDLLSGFPGQVTKTWAEKIVIPQIFTTLLGYLPLPMARARPDPAFGAGCGQLMAVRRGAYDAAGGHAGFAARMHDGLELPRRVRASGGRTDLCDATPIATCRMYDSAGAIWQGFSKNATEGMATKRALPVWTVLLFGGHVLPFLTLAAALIWGGAWSAGLSALACALVLGARAAMAVRLRQPWLSVAAHPLGVMVVLAIQWCALWNGARGRRAGWRGRDYPA